MSGNLLNNSQVLELVDANGIKIEPFVASRLRLAHYPLTIYALFAPQAETNAVQVHCFDRDGDEFMLPPNAYVIAEVRETIAVSPGIIGKFLPSSNLVDQRIGLTAGRVEYPFGQNRETLRFGVKNLCDMPTVIKRNDYVAYVEFYDLRGVPAQPVGISARDADIFERRRVDEARFYRANDDGPFYTTDAR